MPDILIVRDMIMTKDHIKYVEDQMKLGKASVLEVDPPLSWEGFEDLVDQLGPDLPVSTLPGHTK